MLQQLEINWRWVNEDPPCRGVFVELARPVEIGILGVVEKIDPKTAVRTYWDPSKLQAEDTVWRIAATPNFIVPATLTANEQIEQRPPIDEDFWYVVLVEPNQELTTTWRLHEQGRELYVPIIRRRVKTGRTGKNGQKVTRMIPKPMFPGYGFIRRGKDTNINDIISTRGVREMLRDKGIDDGRDNFVTLPHEAVLAVFRKQSQKHLEFAQESISWRHRPKFKKGASVRVQAEGNVYDGYLANIEKDDGKGRIEVLLGKMAIRHTLPSDMVVAA